MGYFQRGPSRSLARSESYQNQFQSLNGGDMILPDRIGFLFLRRMTVIACLLQVLRG